MDAWQRLFEEEQNELLFLMREEYTEMSLEHELELQGMPQALRVLRTELEAINDRQWELTRNPFASPADVIAAADAWNAKMDEIIAMEEALEEQDAPLIVMMEDPIIHTDFHPFCGNVYCPCYQDKELYRQYVQEPLLNGLITEDEAVRIYSGKQI